MDLGTSSRPKFKRNSRKLKTKLRGKAGAKGKEKEKSAQPAAAQPGSDGGGSVRAGGKRKRQVGGGQQEVDKKYKSKFVCELLVSQYILSPYILSGDSIFYLRGEGGDSISLVQSIPVRIFYPYAEKSVSDPVLSAVLVKKAKEKHPLTRKERRELKKKKRKNHDLISRTLQLWEKLRRCENAAKILEFSVIF